MNKYLTFVVFFIYNTSFAIPSSLNCTIDNVTYLAKPLKIMMESICDYIGNNAIFVFDYKNLPSSIVNKITSQNFYIVNKLFSTVNMSYEKFQQLITSESKNTNSLILNSELQQINDAPWIANVLNVTQPTLMKTYVASVNQLFEGMGNKDDPHAGKSFKDCYIYSVYTLAGIVIASILIGSACGIASCCIEKRRQKRAFPSLIGNSISP